MSKRRAAKPLLDCLAAARIIGEGGKRSVNERFTVLADMIFCAVQQKTLDAARTRNYVAVHNERFDEVERNRINLLAIKIAWETNMAAAKKTATAEMFDMKAFGPESFKEGYEKFAEGVSSFADFQKESLNALMASASAFAKGVEKLTAEQAAFTKASFEDTVATAKAAAATKTLQEAIELNSDFVRASVEKNLGQINKVADIWTSTAKDTVEPLTVRYTELVEKIQAYRP
jgi:phasin family protein